MACAAAATFCDVFGFVTGLDEPGFSGRGGGARSGSELSHLKFMKTVVSMLRMYLPFFNDLEEMRVLGATERYTHRNRSTSKIGG